MRQLCYRLTYANVNVLLLLVLYRILRLLLIPRFAEILVLPARPAVQALRCRALTAGESVSAVRRERKRSVSLQKPPLASFQGCQEFIGLISVGGAATEESTAAAAAGQTPGKTVAIAADASKSTDFPLRAERNQKMPLTVLTFSASCE